MLCEGGRLYLDVYLTEYLYIAELPTIRCKESKGCFRYLFPPIAILSMGFVSADYIFPVVAPLWQLDISVIVSLSRYWHGASSIERIIQYPLLSFSMYMFGRARQWVENLYQPDIDKFIEEFSELYATIILYQPGRLPCRST